MPQLTSFAPARPEEILLPVKPWFVLLTLHRRPHAAMCCRRPGLRSCCKPDFLALVLLYWCIQEPRLIGVGIAVVPGTAHGRGRCDACSDSTRSPTRCSRMRRSISGGACCGFRSGSRRRRWRCCCLLCAALVLLVRVVGGAPLPRWSYAVGPLTGALLWPAADRIAAMAAASASVARGTLTGETSRCADCSPSAAVRSAAAAAAGAQEYRARACAFPPPARDRRQPC